MKNIQIFIIFSIACIGLMGCASGHKHWKPVAGWETLDAKHRMETIEHCQQDAEFERCMYANSYVYSKHGSVMPDQPNSSRKEISTTELIP